MTALQVCTGKYVPDKRRKLVKGSHSHIKSDTSLATLVPKEEIFETSETRKISTNAIRNLENLNSDSIVGLVQKVLEEEIVALLEEGLEMRLDLKGLVSKEIQLNMGSHNKGVESCKD